MPEITFAAEQKARLSTATANIRQAMATYYCRFQEEPRKQDTV
jgi:hypothetical protein